jgi:hypothetical protein
MLSRKCLRAPYRHVRHNRDRCRKLVARLPSLPAPGARRIVDAPTAISGL